MGLRVLVVFLVAVAVSAHATASIMEEDASVSWEEEVAHYGHQQKVMARKHGAVQESLATKTVGIAGTQEGRLMNSDPKGGFGIFKPNKVNCLICSLAFNVLIDIVMTPSLEQDLKGVVNTTCQRLSNETIDQTQCEQVAGLVIDLLHEAEQYGMTSGFNTSQVACTTILGYCTVPCCATPNTPEQVHLTLVEGDSSVPKGRTTAMRVSWVSANNYTSNSPPMVAYRALHSDGFKGRMMKVYGTSSTYYSTGWIGWLHTAVMVELLPGTNYTYTAGSAVAVAGGGPTDTFTSRFKTFESDLGSAERPLRVAMFADMGLGGTHAETVAQLTRMAEEGDFHMVLHTGDISYADGDSFRWDVFMREMQPIVSTVPYMTTPGNHEGLFNFTAYKARFPHPDTSFGGPTDAMYYSFSVGPIRFVMMDSESEWDTPRMDPVQVAWADRVMSDANRQGQFIFAAWHRPAYCSTPGNDCAKNAAWIRGKIESTVTKHGVGIVHSGHVHNYERSYPVEGGGSHVSRNYTDTTAPVYLVNGVPGCEEGFEAFPPGLQFGPFSAAHGSGSTGFMVMAFQQEEFKDSQVARLARRKRKMSATTGEPSSYSLYTVNMTLVSSRNGTALDEIMMTKVVPQSQEKNGVTDSHKKKEIPRKMIS